MRVPKSFTQKIPWMVSLLFILLFVYAALSKLLDFETFETQLGQSPLLSAYAKPVAIGVPILELLIALSLMVSRFRVWGLYGFYCMMVMFTSYILIILNFTSFTPCSCGGVLEDLGWTEHLIFNILFILLSGFVIIILSKKRNRAFLKVGVFTFLGVAIVCLIFLSSEKQNKRNNAFIRRYMPHPIEQIGTLTLKSNSYYIAGMSEKKMYLGNYNAPLYMTTIDSSLQQSDPVRIQIDSTHLPYRKVKLSINPPFFYLGDGTVPVIFRGYTSTWKASVFSYRDAYFSSFTVVDSVSIGITTKSTAKAYNALGLLHKIGDSIIDLNLVEDLLIGKLNNGTFDTDGVLLWNSTERKFIYLYFYQNTYEILDKDLVYWSSGKTIDTINTPILDIAHYSAKKQFELGGKSVLVNRLGATYGDKLFIQSDRLGRYESDKVLRSASIIDVYNIKDTSYVFSFYLYHQRGKNLSEFRIYKNLLVAIVDDQIWLYRLKPEYFDTGFKATHTVQYQD
ncbi:MAG: MauE/DoxX family redox-associated membrane protein [Gelidibacter sp.]